MDDKFLRDRISGDNIEVPESILPENIAKLLEENGSNLEDKEEKIIENDVVGRRKNNIRHDAEKNTEECDEAKRKIKNKNIYRYIKSCALVAAALIVVIAGTSVVERFANKANEDTVGVDMSADKVMETGAGRTALEETTQAAGDMGMKKTKYDELYEKLVQGKNIYDGYYIINDEEMYPLNESDTEAASSVDSSVKEVGTEAGQADMDNTSTKNSDISNGDSLNGETDEDFSKNNDQEEGVSEGNIFLTDGKYLYAMKKPYDVYAGTRYLSIYSVDNENLTKCSEIKLDKVKDNDYVSYEAVYVDSDTLVVTGYAYNEGYGDEKNDFTFGIIYDISDRNEPKYVNTVTQSGYYVSSRIVDGILYLMSWYTPSGNCRQDEFEKYIPMYNDTLAQADNIYCPEYVGDRSYTVIGSVDLAAPMAYKDTQAVVLSPDNMYVSRNAIYFLASNPEYIWDIYDDEQPENETENETTVTSDEDGIINSYNEINTSSDKIKTSQEEVMMFKTNGQRAYDKTKSTLMKLAIDNGDIELVGETQVYGSADSQFSFSEYDGYIRLVTTTTDYSSGKQSCGLYIFDDELALVGHIDGLAEGESVKSVRFVGDMAYFVTFRNTDPLFAVDMSKPDEPVVLDKIKLPGFSEYLHPYGDGRLLGLGYEADENNGALQNVKMSMFDISNPADIEEIGRLQIDSFYSGAMYEHRAILVNADRNLIGFVAEENIIDTDETGANITGRLAQVYRLYSYDEKEGFVQHIECVLDLYSYDYPRANYIGDYLYIFDGAQSIYIYRLTDYEFIGKTVL